MQHRKKSDEGFDERLELLKRSHSNACQDFRQIRAQFRSWDLADDDILDAIAAAITASADPRALRTLPESPPIDSEGRPMEMVYAEDHVEVQ